MASTPPPPLRPIDTSTAKTTCGRNQHHAAVLEGVAAAAEEEPASPATRLFHTKNLNCYIIAVLGCTTKINVEVVKKGLESTLVNHPRFSSTLSEDKRSGKKRWVRGKVDVEKHVICPELGPADMEPTSAADMFVENYTSSLTTKEMDMSKPLWDIHILNVKTSEANSTGILRMHHSLGDGISLISLFLACTRKTSDPAALPTIPTAARTATRRRPEFGFLLGRPFLFLMLVVNTVVDMLLFLATLLFLKDTHTPLKGGGIIKKSHTTDSCGGRVADLPGRRLVHRTISLDDIKLIKNALNVTVNDVLMGILQAGMSRYLNRKYGKQKWSESNDNKNNLPKSVRLRGAVIFNIRPSAGIKALAEMMEKKSKAKWGNKIGYALTPLFIGLQENPLGYIYKAKAIIDRKKLSLESRLSFSAAHLIVKLFGIEAAAALTNRVIANTTVLVSNVVGPEDEISFFGHSMVFAAPAVYGVGHALTIHFQSYCNKMTISMAVDPEVISDPYQLCDDLEHSLEMFKDALKISTKEVVVLDVDDASYLSIV
ncbi:unnamed protein product [Cuscuta campestris]|uniref:Uncharacterized protein n=1 Tax=Cuscuta campestris TaxID=132261 RepID=A0A484KSR5_9ASTE|nr:unnamed protein product [Cuscuta campestris]